MTTEDRFDLLKNEANSEGSYKSDQLKKASDRFSYYTRMEGFLNTLIIDASYTGGVSAEQMVQFSETISKVAESSSSLI